MLGANAHRNESHRVPMISFLASKDGRLVPQERLSPGCWVEVLEPSGRDLAWLGDKLAIAPEFLQEACDDEETSHVDIDEETGQVLVTVDCPFKRDDEDDPSVVQFDTHPLTFIFLPGHGGMVTVSLRPNDILDGFVRGAHRGVDTTRETRLLLLLLLKIAQRYLACLRSINSQIRSSEDMLRKKMNNDELMRMLSMEKSLVYFSTSIQGLQATAKRIGTGRTLALGDGDAELLDDVLIEVSQAVEMCATCSQILNSVTDTFSNVISNNLNYTMRTLTVITLIISIPAGIFGFYGMNVPDLPWVGSWVSAVAVSAVLVAVAWAVLRVMRLLK